MSFSLRNTSSKPDSLAVRVRVMLQPTAAPSHIDSPLGWKPLLEVCPDGEMVCAVWWQALNGLPAGASIGGFAVVATREAQQVRGWGVDLAECSVGGLQNLAIH